MRSSYYRYDTVPDIQYSNWIRSSVLQARRVTARVFPHTPRVYRSQVPGVGPLKCMVNKLVNRSLGVAVIVSSLGW